jgi:hypothetical protein
MQKSGFAREDQNGEYLIDEATRNKRAGRTGKFNPTHLDVEKAIDEYMRKGGKITRIRIEDSNIEDFLNQPVDLSGNADTFLFGVL